MEALEEWIGKLSEQQRQAVRFASIDMWAPYYYAVRNKLPHVKIVVDRLHVMTHLNKRITQVRTNIQNSASDDIKDILKGSRWILVKNRSGLSVKEEEKLQKILEACPQLRVIYLLKEEFRQIFDRVDSREKAERFLRAWVLKAEYSGDKFLKKFVKTLKNWWKQILNYFYERITNGFVEGLNGAIRNIIRRAFGYRNFQNFKLQVFAEHGFPTNPR
jgi:transposase